MSNDVLAKEEFEIVDKKVEDLSIFNEPKGEEILPISIIVKNVKSGKGNTFKSIKGQMYLPCYEEGNFIGYNNRKIDIHFKKDAFDDVVPECKIHKSEDLSTGTLYVRKKGVQAPSRYEVTIEDGKEVYPQIWIRNSIIGFVPYTIDEEKFKYHPQIKDAEVLSATEASALVDEDDEELKGM